MHGKVYYPEYYDPKIFESKGTIPADKFKDCQIMAASILDNEKEYSEGFEFSVSTIRNDVKITHFGVFDTFNKAIKSIYWLW